MNKAIQVVGSLTDLNTQPPSLEECDIIEIRLDNNLNLDKIRAFLSQCPQKTLFTYRDIKEGGILESSIETRLKTLEEILDIADYIDIELRNWSKMESIVRLARNKGCVVIASHHNFKITPSSEEIDNLINNAKTHQPDIIKFAFMTHSIADIARCQSVLFSNPEFNISIMGMGDYAPTSRVLLAQSGSTLNYGYLGTEETAPGQWPARLLKSAITSCKPLNQ